MPIHSEIPFPDFEHTSSPRDRHPWPFGDRRRPPLPIDWCCAILSLTISAVGLHAETPPGPTYLFRYQSAPVGQHIWQHVTMFANLTTTFEQSGQKISQTNQLVTREQIRRLEVIENQKRQSEKVRVHYEKARDSVIVRGRPAEEELQVVAEKVYIVWRVDKELIVQREDGSEPTAEEISIVQSNMQAVGRPNPLATYLNGRRVRIGERIKLPPDVAADLLGWKDEFGAVKQVDLTLQEVQPHGDNSQAGLFHAIIVGSPSGTTDGEGTRMVGQLSVELSTCRTLSVDMQADLKTREERGPKGHTFFVSNRGRANIHTQARFLEP